MEIMIQQLVNGLFLGSIYALMALGYTMVYGIIGLINFAHGDIYMIGSFVGYFLINLFNTWKVLPNAWGFFIALAVSMVVCAILGVVIEFLAYRPLRKSERITALITAIGVSYLLQNLMIYFRSDIYMIGSFVGYFLINLFNTWKVLPNAWGFFIALAVSMVVCAILGVVIEFLAYRPLRKSERITALITAIGVSYLLQNLMIYF